MIDIYYANTPNVFKVTIAVEELGLESQRIPVDLTKGDQFAPEFLAISPNNRVPAIVDRSPAGGGEPVALFESGAILIYLAEKTGKLLANSEPARSTTLQWLMWQMSGLGPMLGQLGHFSFYAPERISYAIERYKNEATRLYSVLNRRLTDHEYLADEYSIADIACWPWIIYHEHSGIRLKDYPAVERWYSAIEQRPAVKRALEGVVITGPVKVTDEVRKILFQQAG